MKQAAVLLTLTIASLAAQAQTPAPMPRLVCLYLDLNSMDADAQSAALQRAATFVQNQLPGDMISVMTYTTAVNVLSDFTDNHEATLATLRMIQPAAVADTREPILAADARLAAIQSAVKILAALPEKKAMIYFSNDAGRGGIDDQDQLHAVVNAAVRANVAIFPIDARGLVQAVR